MIALAKKNQNPANNPDQVSLTATVTGNYGVNGVGDLLNLGIYALGLNPGGITDPANSGFPEWPVAFNEPPRVVSEDLGGYYAQVHQVPAAPLAPVNGVAPTVPLNGGYAVRFYAPGGAELATGSAYPAAILGGVLQLEVVMPHNQ